LALGRYGHLELRSNGGIEAGAGCRSVLESGEMEPSQVVVEVFGGHTAPDAQEGLDPLMQAVDGLDVQFATYPLARRLVQYLVGDLHPGGTACQGRAAVGDQQGVFAENGFEHGLDGVSAVHRQDGADDLTPWLAEALESDLRFFAEGLRQDLAVVWTALATPWNGQTEGQIARLKLIKRSMYGRAKLDLLRIRVMAA
jgi:hypothetical protein